LDLDLDCQSYICDGFGLDWQSKKIGLSNSLNTHNDVTNCILHSKCTSLASIQVDLEPESPYFCVATLRVHTVSKIQNRFYFLAKSKLFVVLFKKIKHSKEKGKCLRMYFLTTSIDWHGEKTLVYCVGGSFYCLLESNPSVCFSQKLNNNWESVAFIEVTCISIVEKYRTL